MSLLAIKKQVVNIVQTLAYKAYGFNVHYPWYKAQLCINKQQQKVGYKVSIPSLIYSKYSEEGFIYSQPGTTPKQIAEDILVHFKSLDHVQMQSDQFGNIMAYVKGSYFQQKSEEFMKQNKIITLKLRQLDYHHNQSIKIQKEAKVEKNIKMVLFKNNTDKTSLSQLRQQFIFSSIENMQQSIFNSNVQRVNIVNNKKSSKIQDKSQNKLSGFSLNTDQLLYGCLRHQVIARQSILQNLTDLNLDKLQKDENENIKLFKFGIVVPENVFLNQQNKHVLFLQQQGQINKLRKISYDFPIYKPINLPLVNQTHSHFKTLINKNQLSLTPTVDQLILKIDQLTSQHKITQLYHLYLLLDALLSSLPKNNFENSNKRTQYLNIAKITKDHLHQIFFQ